MQKILQAIEKLYLRAFHMRLRPSPGVEEIVSGLPTWHAGFSCMRMCGSTSPVIVGGSPKLLPGTENHGVFQQMELLAAVVLLTPSRAPLVCASFA